MEKNTAISGLLCLKALLSQCRSNTNTDSVLSRETVERYVANAVDTLVDLAKDFSLGPELVDPRKAELCASRSGAALLPLKNGNWLLIVRASQFAGESVTCFDTANPNNGKPVAYPVKELLEKAGENMIYFSHLQEVDSVEQSGIFCLTTIARHHHVRMDMRQVMHDFAVSSEEPTLPQLLDIAQSYGFKTGKKKLSWEKMLRVDQAFPLIGIKKDGKYFVVAGVRRKSKDKQ